MKFKNRRAFTVMEIIVVLCTIAIMFLVLIPKMDIGADKARVSAVQSDLKVYYTAAQKVILEVPDITTMSTLEFENALNANLDPSYRFEDKQSKNLDPWFQPYRFSTGMIGDKYCIIFASEGDDTNYRFSTSDMSKIEVVNASEGEFVEEEVEEFVPRITLAFAVVDGDIFTLEEKEHEIMETSVSELETPITGSLQDITVAEGAPFTFKVNLIGNTSGLNFTWYRSGDLIPDENSNTLTMIADERFNGDRFVCYIEKNGKVYTTNTATLTVVSNLVTNVRVNTMPVKTEYFEGQSFSDIGLTLEVSYSNGTTAIVTDYTIENGTRLSGGQESVKVSWQDWVFAIPINVVSESPIGILINKLPSKTTYIETQDFDPSGMVILVEYNNGAKEAITNYTVTGGTKLKPGTQTISISYGGFTQTLNVNVVQLQVTSLEVINQPTKKRYLVNTNFDTNGLQVRATWNNGTSKVVTQATGTTDNGAGYTPVTKGYTIVDGISLKEGQTAVTLRMDNALVAIPIEVYVHEHTGQAGLSYSNGCYTKAVLINSYCPTHQVTTSHEWGCGWCGTRVWSLAAPSKCPNNVCGSGTSGQRWSICGSDTTTVRCSEPCVKQYRYDLGCGYN